jgi:hypothetical protein
MRTTTTWVPWRSNCQSRPPEPSRSCGPSKRERLSDSDLVEQARSAIEDPSTSADSGTRRRSRTLGVR